jgi:uncharacterized protein YraI
VVAAGVPLNLLQESRLEATVLQTIPQGSLLVRGAGAETNRLVPVTFGGVSGWVIADGIIPAPETATYATTSSPTTAPAPSATTSTNTRVTLAPLMLRSAPAMEADPILVMPLGEAVTLTWEGAENGYVTVDYGGVRGWAYADLLAEPGGTARSGAPSAVAVIDDSAEPVAMEPEPLSEGLVYEDPVAAAPVNEAPVVYAEPVAECDPSYPDLCIPPGSADLDCLEVGSTNFRVLPPDPHGFDGDGNGVGCENP